MNKIDWASMHYFNCIYRISDSYLELRSKVGLKGIEYWLDELSTVPVWHSLLRLDP